MIGEGVTQNPEIPRARPLTHGEFYLAMMERPDPSGLGLRPEWRNFFVGQERAYRQLYDAITQSPSGTVVAITAPFGSGKDTLLDVVLTDLINQGKIHGQEAQRVQVYDLEEGQSFEQTRRRFSWVAEPENPQSIEPKVLSINEVAYGWMGNSKATLQRQLAIAGGFLGREVPVIVLLGDYALEDPEIVGALGSPYEPTLIKLDPLTPNVLKQALRTRLAYALDRNAEEIDIESMLDPQVLTPLIPNTNYPIAVMRNTLVELGNIGMRLKPTEEPLTITGELVRKIHGKEWYDSLWHMEDRQQQFMLWLIGHINSHDNGQRLMMAMTSDEMMQACPLDIEPERYKRRIVDALTSSGRLQKVSAEPDLYLPRPEVFLMAALRQFPLNLQSEEGQSELKRVVEDFEKKVYQPKFQQLEGWEETIKRIELIYGWDRLVTLALIQEAYETHIRRYKESQQG